MELKEKKSEFELWKLETLRDRFLKLDILKKKKKLKSSKSANRNGDFSYPLFAIHLSLREKSNIFSND